MRTLAIIIAVALAAAFIAPLVVTAGSKLAAQAKKIWGRK